MVITPRSCLNGHGIAHRRIYLTLSADSAFMHFGLQQLQQLAVAHRNQISYSPPAETRTKRCWQQRGTIKKPRRSGVL